MNINIFKRKVVAIGNRTVPVVGMSDIEIDLNIDTCHMSIIADRIFNAGAHPMVMQYRSILWCVGIIVSYVTIVFN